MINTLIDTLQTRLDMGYKLFDSTRQVNVLQYTDDICLLADSPAATQHLLDMVGQWLQWSGMRANLCKCHSLAVQGSTGKLINPDLKLAGKPIPFIGNGSIKFLGMRIQVPHDVTATKEALITNLDQMLQAVDACPLTRHQKLRLYKAGIYLSTLLLIEEPPSPGLRKYNTAMLYLPQKMGGLCKSPNINILVQAPARFMAVSTAHFP